MKFLLTTVLLFSSTFAISAPVPKITPPDPTKKPLLGVLFDGGTTIDSFTPEGYAERSGLKVGDRITKIGNIEVKSFPEILDLLWLFRPGALIKVTVERDGRDYEIKIPLVERDSDPVKD